MKVKINKYFFVFYIDFSILPRQMKSLFNHMEEKLGDTKGVVRSHKSKDRHYNGQNKRTNNDQQNTTEKTY